MKDLMQYKGYLGSVHFDAEELFFYGKVEFIRALITYEATNAKELVDEFKNSIDSYLEMCESENLKPDTPFKGSLNVRLGEDLHRQVALAAEKNHASINSYIVDTLSHAVK